MSAGPEWVAETIRTHIDTHAAVFCAALPVPPSKVPVTVRPHDRAHDEATGQYPLVAVIVRGMGTPTLIDPDEQVYRCTYDVTVRIVARNEQWAPTDLDRKRLTHALRNLLFAYRQLAPSMTLNLGEYRERMIDQNNTENTGRTLAGADLMLRVETLEPIPAPGTPGNPTLPLVASTDIDVYAAGWANDRTDTIILTPPGP